MMYESPVGSKAMAEANDYSWNKKALVVLNLFYVLLAFIMIGAAGYGKATDLVTTPSVVAGIMGCGLILGVLAVSGIVGVVTHHQIMLFFYVAVLSLLFLVQLIIACACLAMSGDQQKLTTRLAWMEASSEIRIDTQDFFDCCGIDRQSQDSVGEKKLDHPSCNSPNLLHGCCKNSTAHCCTGLKPTVGYTGPKCPCDSCWDKISPKVGRAFKTVGTLGLFFSLSEIIGIWLAARFREIRQPSPHELEILA